MDYKIAIASGDGKNVDLHFGAASFFYIYEVQDDGAFYLLEKRPVPENVSDSLSADCNAGKVFCSSGKGNGCGCGGNGEPSAKVELLSDCRCIVAARIGFNVTKQLEKKAISTFDVECSVEEALEKITKYFYKLDNHISLKK